MSATDDQPPSGVADDPATVHARLAAIVESSLDAIVATDLQGLVTAWNPAAERLYGYTADEAIGRPLMELIIVEEQYAIFEANLARITNGEALPAWDAIRRTKSGERIRVSVSVSPICDASGAVIGASSIARDISGDLAARAERARLAAIVDSTSDAVVAVDTDGRVTSWNRASESLYGYSAAEILGHHLRELIPPERAEEGEAVRERILRGESIPAFDTVRLHKSGKSIPVSIAISPIVDADGTVVGGSSVARDISEQRAAERRAREAAEREARLHQELEQARRLESVGQLAGGIAHDFNNLLSVILNLSMLVSDGLPEGSQAREDVGEITTTAQRAAALTRQLLIFSRRDVVEPETLDVGSVVADLRPLLASAVPERIELDLRSAPDPWHITVDRGQLEQVVVNLVLNARDAIERGGRIVVETRNTVVDEAFAETLPSLDPGAYVTLIVSDTGAGMARDVSDRAFEPFFTTKPFGEGTGLGLSTVYGIVQGAGGRVGVYSEVGHGTTIQVHFPATNAPIDVVHHSPDGATGSRGECVALVEDHPDLRRITSRLLSSAGYEVIVAEDAAEAVRLLSITPDIDALVTDVILPGTSGVELAGQLRALRPELRVLFTSGYSHSLLTTAALRQPRTAFLEKPFTAADLRSQLRALLDGDATAAGD